MTRLDLAGAALAVALGLSLFVVLNDLLPLSHSGSLALGVVCGIVAGVLIGLIETR